ncbi:hypothetical protein F4801DRAFT_581366 [Xylaria longipes]|nr:hypothetical protein F4801DRAFT_581366 [Xylaria longipes]
MTMPLKPNHLYVAFQYPRDPEMDFELCPELLPENLRWQANGEREFEYTWSFIVTAEINGQVVTKQYSLISGTVPENNPSVMERCIRNEHLLTFSRYIETSVRSPGILASIPRLMVLLEMQPVNTKYFEKFLANHNAVANWPAITWGAHMTHLWARNILVDCKAININDETITSVEEAARISLRKHQLLRHQNHNWSSFTNTPLWQVHVYDPSRRNYRRIGDN